MKDIREMEREGESRKFCGRCGLEYTGGHPICDEIVYRPFAAGKCSECGVDVKSGQGLCFKCSTPV